MNQETYNWLAVEERDVIKIIGGSAGFIGCFGVVEEVRSWGVKAMVFAPGSGEKHEYPIRLEFTHFVVIGKDWSPR
jgi:hypothetical protein